MVTSRYDLSPLQTISWHRELTSRPLPRIGLIPLKPWVRKRVLIVNTPATDTDERIDFAVLAYALPTTTKAHTSVRPREG